MRAIDRYEGVFFRVLKKYLKEGLLRDVDILIITKRHGLIGSEEFIPYEPTFTSKVLSKDASKMRDQNLRTLSEWLSRKQYSEIYVNCGQEFMQLIKGFEKLTTSKITFAVGSRRGIGPKAAHMKNWILERSESMYAERSRRESLAHHRLTEV